MPRKITEYFLYRHRYIIGYVFLVLVILGGFAVALLYVPGGISQEEIKASTETSALSIKDFQPEMVVNLPYYLLQRASFAVLGVSNISIKLPSMILAISTAAGLYMLLRHWFKNSTAIPATVIAITSPQFIFMAQNGTPMILFSSLSIWLILISTFVIWHKRPAILWQLALFCIVALIMYVPLGVYLVLALCTTLVFHPHVRSHFKRLPRPKLAISAGLGAILLAPLAYAIYKDWTILRSLFGIPATLPDIGANTLRLLNDWFNFISPTTGILITPVYSLSITLLMILGIYRLSHVRYTARSYLTWAWIILLIPLIVINPNLGDASFIIMAILVAQSLSLLLTNWWYKLFPLNPYARLIGMLLVSALVFGIVSSNIYRYVYSTFYSPLIAKNFSKDLTVLNSEVNKYSHGGTPPTVVVTKDQYSFYHLVSIHSKKFNVSTSPENITSSTIIITHDAMKNHPNLGEPTKIITTGIYENSDRFYVYNNGKK